MADDMKNTRQHTKLRAKTKTHVDVSDLSNRRIRNHSADTVFPDRVDRADDHTRDSEHEEHMNDLAVLNYLESDHAVKDLEQQ